MNQDNALHFIFRERESANEVVSEGVNRERGKVTSGISLTIYPIHQSLQNEKGQEGTSERRTRNGSSLTAV